MVCEPRVTVGTVKGQASHPGGFHKVKRAEGGPCRSVPRSGFTS